MNINLTLIGQSIAFAVFVWFCVKFIWPPLIAALNERRQTIADGLAAAERGVKERAAAKLAAAETVAEAKTQARAIINQAETRHAEIVERAKADAKQEADKIIAAAGAQAEQATHQAREALRGKVAELAIAAAAKVLQREVSPEDHEAALAKLAAEL